MIELDLIKQWFFGVQGMTLYKRVSTFPEKPIAYNFASINFRFRQSNALVRSKKIAPTNFSFVDISHKFKNSVFGWSTRIKAFDAICYLSKYFISLWYIDFSNVLVNTLETVIYIIYIINRISERRETCQYQWKDSLLYSTVLQYSGQ